METILFVPSVAGTEWAFEALQGKSPAELPVAGRRYIDYAFECAGRFGILMAEVLDWHFSEKLADDFSDLTRTGTPVFYQRGEGAPPMGLDDLAGVSSPLTQTITDGLFVIWGLCITGHGIEDVSLEPVSPEECAVTPPGQYRREGGRWMRVLPRGLVVDGVKAWHKLNFAVLHSPDKFTLPGYSAEAGVHLGRNVVMEHGTEAKPPLLLQDGAWCARNVQLEGDVIVGRNAFVSEGARLRRTVVADDTFVGPGLELVDKIVVGRRVMDAETGAWTDIEEPGVARRLGDVGGVFARLWSFLQGRSKGRGA